MIRCETRMVELGQSCTWMNGMLIFFLSVWRKRCIWDGWSSVPPPKLAKTRKLVSLHLYRMIHPPWILYINLVFICEAVVFKYYLTVFTAWCSWFVNNQFVLHAHRLPKPTVNTENLKPSLQMTTLSNGVRVYSEDHHGQIANMGVFIDTGSVHEDTNGLCHFFERMAWKSTSNRTHQQFIKYVL